MTTSNRTGSGTWHGLALAGLLATVALPARAAGDDALQILKAMSDYVGSQQTISATFDSSIEVITPQLEKLQFDNSGEATISRPDKVRAHRFGGYADVELVYDGATLSVLDKGGNRFAQLPATGTIDQLVDELQPRSALGLPAADLLLADSYSVLSADVLEAKHIGRGIVDGVECDHLAFRNFDTDWQLWVEVGDHPIPRKLVITSKTINSAPQYTVTIKSFETGGKLAASTFEFVPPKGASKVEVAAFDSLDEMPPSADAKGAK